MKKKVLATLLMSAVMATSVCVAAGCGGGSGAYNGPDADGDVVMAFLGLSQQADMGKVEAAVSKYTNEKLGFGVKFDFIEVGQQDEKYNSRLVSGQQLDLLNISFGDPSNFIKQKKVREIESLITEENTPNLKKIISDNPSVLSRSADNVAYGLSNLSAMYAYGGTYMVRKDVLEAVGLYGEGDKKYVENEKVTYEDLDYIFKTISENDEVSKPGGIKAYPCGNLASDDVVRYFIPFDPVCSAVSAPVGVIMMNDYQNKSAEEKKKIVNLYETDEYKEYTGWMKKWANAGYMHSDAANTTSTVADNLRSGRFLGCFTDIDPQFAPEYTNDYGNHEQGKTFMQLTITDPYMYCGAAAVGWYVNYQSKMPKKAMKLLDLIWSDKYLVNLFMYGIEGTQYNFVEGYKEDGMIEEIAQGRANYTVGGFYGNQKDYYYIKVGNDAAAFKAQHDGIIAKRAEFETAALANSSAALNFLYDSSKQTNRIKNVVNAINQYAGQLSVGKGDYDAFISKLKSVKINDVIADKQKQLDEWLAKK